MGISSLLKKCSHMACASNSLCQPSPTPGLLAAELLLPAGERAKADIWRLKNQSLGAGEALQPWKVAHLGEGKP